MDCPMHTESRNLMIEQVKGICYGYEGLDDRSELYRILIGGINGDIEVEQLRMIHEISCIFISDMYYRTLQTRQ